MEDCGCPLDRDTLLHAPHAAQNKTAARWCDKHGWCRVTLDAYVAEWNERVKIAEMSGVKLDISVARSLRDAR